MSKRNKKPNNIGTDMHTVSYLGQSYIKSDYKKPLTLQEIVENQEKHIMLIPRSKEDQAYIEELESFVIENIPENILLKKCESYFTDADLNMTESEISKAFERRYCAHKTEEKIDLKKSFDALFNSDGPYVEPEIKIEPHTCEQKLNLLCHCHNCNGFFPLRNLKWIDSGESDDLDSKYYGLEPKCAKYPICPSSWSRFDLWLREEQYSLEDHKKGKYDQ